MVTQIFAKENLDIAAKALQQGEIRFSSNGNGADCGLNRNKSRSCFKGVWSQRRPSDNPLIVHISDIQQMTSTVEEVPEIAHLSEGFCQDHWRWF